MLNTLTDYRDRLCDKIKEYMECAPINDDTAHGIGEMLECLEYVDDMIGKRKSEKTTWETPKFTESEAYAWCDKMQNDDGTTGPHWSIEQTSAYMPQEICDRYVWYAAMNMVYSDYCYIGNKYGISTPDFYADVAKAFLLDADGGGAEHKISRYYQCIAK